MRRDRYGKGSALLAGLVVMALAGGSSVAVAEEKDDTTPALEDFGDVMQFALPLAALGATFAANDPDGRAQFFKSYLTAWGTTTSRESASANRWPGR